MGDCLKTFPGAFTSSIVEIKPLKVTKKKSATSSRLGVVAQGVVVNETPDYQHGLDGFRKGVLVRYHCSVELKYA